jgi:hypothetical protein
VHAVTSPLRAQGSSAQIPAQAVIEFGWRFAGI